MDAGNGKKLYSIGELAEIVQLPASALRFYDEQGVLSPAVRDPSSRYRYYTEQQVMAAMLIAEMRRVGLSVDVIREMFQTRSLGVQRDKLTERLAELQNEIDSLLFKKTYIQEVIHNIDDWGGYVETSRVDADFSAQVLFRSLPEAWTVYVPVRGCFYEQEKFSRSQKDLYDLCEKYRLRVAGVATSVFMDEGMEHFRKEIYDSEWRLPVEEPALPCPAVKKIPAVRCVCSAHLGSYQTIEETYRRIYAYIEKNGLSVCGNPMEEYLISCAMICGSDNFVTNVMIPVA